MHFHTVPCENLANKAWFVLNTCQYRARFIEAFNEMKVGKFYDAWCNLEQVEIGVFNLLNNPFYKLKDFSLRDLREVVTNWQSLYPYAVFLSPEMIIKKEYAVCADRMFIRGHRAHIWRAGSTEEGYAAE